LHDGEDRIAAAGSQGAGPAGAAEGRGDFVLGADRIGWVMAVTFCFGAQSRWEAGAGELRDQQGTPCLRLEGERLWVSGGPGRELVVEPEVGAPGDAARAEHPVFGRCLRITSDGQLRSLMGAVDWAAPASIPPVAEPARLPALTGTMLLNAIALAAATAGLSALRYVGPYPTAALYASLRQCFAASGSEEQFTARGDELLLAPRMAEAPVAFSPAPFERWWPTSRLGVQARQQIERVFIDGAAFEREGAGVRRLVDRGPDGDEAGAASREDRVLAAELWFGDARWAVLAELSLAGEVLRGPLPLPVLADPIVGQELPLPLRRALATLIAESVPAPLSPLVAPLLEAANIRWGDAGTSSVRATGDDVTLHAALWLTLRPHGPARLALAIAEALTPWITARAVQHLQRAQQSLVPEPSPH
jgi:hypothetical protein